MTDKSLKNFYNQTVVEDIASGIAATYKSFQREEFVADVMSELPELELKARALCITAALRKHLPQDYAKAIDILVRSMGQDNGSDGFEGMQGFKHLPFLNFVESYGLPHPELSLKTLHKMTKHFSAEFAIRPYLLAHQELTFETIHKWSKDKDWRVRRLASEGTRPRLPWGLRLKEFVINPMPIIPILDALYTDENEVVRRSVANSLNDISKNHPVLAVEIATRWLQQNSTPETMQLVKHALRTLRKKSDKATSKLIGIAHNPELTLLEFKLEKDFVSIGDNIDFTLTLVSKEQKTMLLVIQYAIHHRRKNGTTHPKIFKLAEREIACGESVTISKKHSFRKLTTRSYYPGEHIIEIFAGGVSLDKKQFKLVVR